MSTPGALLLYRGTCAKCRRISLAIVWLSLGYVRRIPLSSPEASQLCARHGLLPGKLVLVGQQRVFAGWRALGGLFVLPVSAILTTFLKPEMKHRL
jgi:hypothetical protein